MTGRSTKADRVVFRGSEGKDEKFEVAMFQELASPPASMQGSKTADLFGCLHSMDIEQADAQQAYT